MFWFLIRNRILGIKSKQNSNEQELNYNIYTLIIPSPQSAVIKHSKIKNKNVVDSYLKHNIDER